MAAHPRASRHAFVLIVRMQIEKVVKVLRLGASFLLFFIYEDALASYDNEQSFVVQEIQSMGEINVSELSNYSVGTMVCNSEQVSMTILIVAYTSEVCLIRLFYGSIKYITGSFRI